ncbi:M55 family metallopeptidase [Sorangium sp. So ce394]|uniref:M55 family metallopeptidase n=1 Tax=Sorangium sp. So ce394 TaxID=3133310 RepID=UPI003F5CB110
MFVLISIDLEGCAGVVHVDQTRRGGGDYERARAWMSREANAAALGAFEAGATRVVVNDSHADMRNLLFEELDPRVEVISGALKPLSMVQGMDAGQPAAAFFVGYHGGAGLRASVLDHTYYGAVVGEIRLHPASGAADDPGLWVDEAAINALVLGEAGVPVALVTGDEAVTAHASERFPGVTTVAVKSSITRYSARSIHPEEACRRIRAAASEALRGLARVRPYTLPPPIGVTFSLLTTAYADAAELVPGVVRLDARRVSYVAPSAREVLRAVLAITKIAGTVVV